jgi:uncharacterized OB-fold protein
VSGEPELLVSRCLACHNRFLPRVGPCPRCGSTSLAAAALPGRGTVLAAVELVAPASGWSAPHHLALIELSDAVRVLAWTGESLPRRGASVLVTRDGDQYRAAPLA